MATYQVYPGDDVPDISPRLAKPLGVLVPLAAAVLSLLVTIVIYNQMT